MVERHVKALERIGRTCSNGFVSLCTCSCVHCVHMDGVNQIFLCRFRIISRMCTTYYTYCMHICTHVIDVICGERP